VIHADGEQFLHMHVTESVKQEAYAMRRIRRILLKTFLFAIVAGVLTALAIVWQAVDARGDRRDFAVDMQKEFSKHGLAYAVATGGGEDDVLTIKAASMTRPFAEFLLQNPGKAERLSDLGFTAVVFANERGGAWTYDLGKRRLK
jgi:hypothetical protein